MNVEQFKAAFNDLARPNRFQVFLSHNGGQPNLSFFCKSSSAPSQTVAAVDVNYQGRIIKLPGDRTNPTWTMKVYGSNSYEIYNSFNSWLTQSNDAVLNIGDTAANLKEDAIVNQLDRQDNVINSWRLVGVFPTEIGEIAFDWGTDNTVLEFDVTFAIDYLLVNQ